MRTLNVAVPEPRFALWTLHVLYEDVDDLLDILLDGQCQRYPRPLSESKAS